MCLGIAIVTDNVPTELAGQFGRGRRRDDRAGRAEYRFLWKTMTPRLPILRGGQMMVARWGNSRGQSRGLPRTGWTWYQTVKDGGWLNLGGVPIEIPASYALEGRGVWYLVEVGIRGVLVPDEQGNAVAYMICEPASHYYRVMTGSDRMPVFINQRI